MKNSEFQENLGAAQTMQKIEPDANKQDFWRGYQRGLRRFYHGENFGTDDEHKRYLAMADSESRKMLGLGYRSGYAGRDIQDALKTMNPGGETT